MTSLAETPIDEEFRDKFLRQMVRPLQEQLELPVYPDAAAWSSTQKIDFTTRGLTVGQLRDRLAALGFVLRLEDDALYLEAAPS